MFLRGLPWGTSGFGHGSSSPQRYDVDAGYGCTNRCSSYGSSSKSIIESSLSPLIGGLQVAGLAGLLLVIWILWGVIRPAPYLDWPPTASSAQAVGEFLTNGVMGMNAYWLTSIFMIFGAFYVMRSRNRSIWLVGAWAVVAGFYIVGRYLPYESGRNAITGVWYNDVYRIAALTPIMASLLAALGVHCVSEYMVRKIKGIGLNTYISGALLNRLAV